MSNRIDPHVGGEDVVARMNAGRQRETERNGRLHPLARAVDEAAAALAVAVETYHEACIAERKNTRRDSHGDLPGSDVLGNAARHIRAAVVSHEPLCWMFSLTQTNPAFALASLHPAAAPAEQKLRDLADFLRPATKA